MEVGCKIRRLFVLYITLCPFRSKATCLVRIGGVAARRLRLAHDEDDRYREGMKTNVYV